MNGIILFAGLILFLWLGRSILIPLFQKRKVYIKKNFINYLRQIERNGKKSKI